MRQGIAVKMAFNSNCNVPLCVKCHFYFYSCRFSLCHCWIKISIKIGCIACVLLWICPSTWKCDFLCLDFDACLFWVPWLQRLLPLLLRVSIIKCFINQIKRGSLVWRWWWKLGNGSFLENFSFILFELFETCLLHSPFSFDWMGCVVSIIRYSSEDSSMLASFSLIWCIFSSFFVNLVQRYNETHSLSVDLLLNEQILIIIIIMIRNHW